MKPIKKVDDLREQFIIFLALKPARLKYDWNNCSDCACGQFIKQWLGRDPLAWNWNYRYRDPISGKVWDRWNMLAAQHPRTFGGLLKRVQAEC